MKVSKAKQCTSALGWNSPRHQCVLEAAQLENSLAEKALGVLVDTKLNTIWSCIASRVSRELFLSTQPTAGVVGSPLGSRNKRWGIKKDARASRCRSTGCELILFSIEKDEGHLAHEHRCWMGGMETEPLC